MITVKFSTLAGGVFIEVNDVAERAGELRCFRFDDKGNAEYARYADLTSNNPAPRWYGHVCDKNHFVFC